MCISIIINIFAGLRGWRLLLFLLVPFYDKYASQKVHLDLFIFNVPRDLGSISVPHLHHMIGTFLYCSGVKLSLTSAGFSLILDVPPNNPVVSNHVK